jgi:Domain of unknown function (DUF4939)
MSWNLRSNSKEQENKNKTKQEQDPNASITFVNQSNSSTQPLDQISQASSASFNTTSTQEKRMDPEEPITPALTQSSHTTKYRLPEPKPYDGSTEKFPKFASQITRRFLILADTYDSDAKKIAYLTALLDDIPNQWAEGFLEKNPEYWQDFDGFFREFKASFDDIHRESVASLKLRSLRQGQEELSIFNAQFTYISSQTSYNESILKDLYLDAINPEVKLAFSLVVGELDLKAMMNQARKIEASIKSRRVTTPARVTNTVPNRATTVFPYQSQTDTPQLRTVRGPLTPEESLYRAQNNLCGYCGVKNHNIANCPTRPQNSLYQNGVGGPKTSFRSMNLGTDQSVLLATMFAEIQELRNQIGNNSSSQSQGTNPGPNKQSSSPNYLRPLSMPRLPIIVKGPGPNTCDCSRRFGSRSKFYPKRYCG